MRKILFIVVLVLLAVTSVQLWITQEKILSGPSTQSTALIGGAFALTDTNGHVVHDSDFRGHIMLVYFGFTQCPDLCPLTLSMMSKALASLGAKADQVVPLFITVDPEHDTPVVLKDYLVNFDKSFVGLTGTSEQIKQVEDTYKVYAQKQETGAKGEYTFDHSSYIYVMGRDGKFLTVIPANSNDQDIAKLVTPYLGQP